MLNIKNVKLGYVPRSVGLLTDIQNITETIHQLS